MYVRYTQKWLVTRPPDRPLTGRQVKHDANWGSVVDDVRPVIQVVHVIAAVVAAVTKHQLQHQVLQGGIRKSQKGQRHDNQDVPEPTGQLPTEAVWNECSHTSKFTRNNHIGKPRFGMFCCSDQDRDPVYIKFCFGEDMTFLLPQWVSSSCQRCWSAAFPAVAALCWQEAWNRQLWVRGLMHSCRWLMTTIVMHHERLVMCAHK